MSKKKKSSQFPSGQKAQGKLQAQPGSIAQPPIPKQDVVTSVKYNPLDSNEVKSADPTQLQEAAQSPIVRPEQMSLAAYHHIQECLKERSYLAKEEVNAILRLSQHLRVFGLLSAVGYLKHGREGKVQDRTKPMWMPLLWRLVYGDEQRQKDETADRQKLMEKVKDLAENESQLYMVTWRKSLILSNHWNFWAKAHQEEKLNERTQDSNITD